MPGRGGGPVLPSLSAERHSDNGSCFPEGRGVLGRPGRQHSADASGTQLHGAASHWRLESNRQGPGSQPIRVLGGLPTAGQGTVSP